MACKGTWDAGEVRPKLSRMPAHLSGGLTVVTGKLHFRKPDLCKLGQGAFEVFSQFPTQREKLQPNIINPPHLGARRTKRACRKRSGNRCFFEELSSGLTARLKSLCMLPLQSNCGCLNRDGRSQT